MANRSHDSNRRQYVIGGLFDGDKADLEESLHFDLHGLAQNYLLWRSGELSGKMFGKKLNSTLIRVHEVGSMFIENNFLSKSEIDGGFNYPASKEWLRSCFTLTQSMASSLARIPGEDKKVMNLIEDMFKDLVYNSNEKGTKSESKAIKP